jgi:hypothetical protein
MMAHNKKIYTTLAIAAAQLIGLENAIIKICAELGQ